MTKTANKDANHAGQIRQALDPVIGMLFEALTNAADQVMHRFGITDEELRRCASSNSFAEFNACMDALVAAKRLQKGN